MSPPLQPAVAPSPVLGGAGGGRDAAETERTTTNGGGGGARRGCSGCSGRGGGTPPSECAGCSGCSLRWSPTVLPDSPTYTCDERREESGRDAPAPPALPPPSDCVEASGDAAWVGEAVATGTGGGHEAVAVRAATASLLPVDGREYIDMGMRGREGETGDRRTELGVVGLPQSGLAYTLAGVAALALGREGAGLVGVTGVRGAETREGKSGRMRGAGRLPLPKPPLPVPPFMLVPSFVAAGPPGEDGGAKRRRLVALTAPAAGLLGLKTGPESGSGSRPPPRLPDPGSTALPPGLGAASAGA